MSQQRLCSRCSLILAAPLQVWRHSALNQAPTNYHLTVPAFSLIFQLLFIAVSVQNNVERICVPEQHEVLEIKSAKICVCWGFDLQTRLNTVLWSLCFGWGTAGSNSPGSPRFSDLLPHVRCKGMWTASEEATVIPSVSCDGEMEMFLCAELYHCHRQSALAAQPRGACTHDGSF